MLLENKGYLVCATARSGSNYLCGLLRSTNALGQPMEYFNTEAGRRKFGDAYPDEPEGQLQAVIEHAATPNGIYGLKVFVPHFNRMMTTSWLQRLPPLEVVFLRRHDLLGQALSYAKALQTRQWVAQQAAYTLPVFDAALIGRSLNELTRHEAEWRYFFAGRGLEPLNLFYEDVVTAPQAAVDAIARRVGLAQAPQIALDQVKYEVQRDAVSEAWRAQFVALTRKAGAAPQA